MHCQHLLFKLKDVVPVQVLNILKEYLLIKTFKVLLIYVLLALNWSIGRNRNWAKWSGIDVTMFPETGFSDTSVEKILSIRVLVHEVIQVGDVIWGTKEVVYIWSRKSAVLWSFSYFSKSMLKSSNKTISLFLWKQISTKGI